MHRIKLIRAFPIAMGALLATGATAQNMPPAAEHAPANPAVDMSSPDKAAMPASGANSFTEDQARTRLAKHGYTDVANLTKDKDGVWRGKAMSHGKSVKVGLDYKGNITAQ